MSAKRRLRVTQPAASDPDRRSFIENVTFITKIPGHIDIVFASLASGCRFKRPAVAFVRDAKWRLLLTVLCGRLLD